MRLHIEMQGKLANELEDLLNKYLSKSFAELSLGEVIGVLEVTKATLISNALDTVGGNQP